MRAVIAATLVGVALALPGASTGGPTGGCDDAEARATFNAFVTAFTGGQYSDLQAIFAAEPDFMWFTVAPPHGRVGARAFNRATLIPYAKARHGQREVLKLVKFNFAGTQERDGTLLAHFNGRLTRKANDLRIERRGFKAALRCFDQKFIVLSIGTKI